MCKLNNLGHINIDALLFCASGIFSRMKAFFVSNTLAALVFPSFCLGWKLECIDETFLHLIITALLMAVSVNFTYHYIQCPAVPSLHHLDCQFWAKKIGIWILLLTCLKNEQTFALKWSMKRRQNRFFVRKPVLDKLLFMKKAGTQIWMFFT